MLKKTFLHLPSINRQKELSLWRDGISTWECLYRDCEKLFSSRVSSKILCSLEASFKQNDKKNIAYFGELLPHQEHWRLVPENESKVAFVDIETTGLAGPPINTVTTIAILFNGKLYQAHDLKAKKKLVRDVLNEASLFVSYFGKVFDIPFLRKQYGLSLEQPHVDLCFSLRRHGYSGGLKNVQKKLGHIRAKNMSNLDGFDAVRLWHMYCEGNIKALETLLAYNADDVIVLLPLLESLVSFEAKRVNQRIKLDFDKHIPKSKYSGCIEVLRELDKLK
jgi:uncharacterized protein